MANTRQSEAIARWLNSAPIAACATSTSGNFTLTVNGKDFVRLTLFNDYEGWKASSPVITTDGKLMTFQVAHTSDRARVGHRIVLYRS